MLKISENIRKCRFFSIFLVILKFEIFFINILHMSATFMIFFRIVTALLITKIAVTNPILHPTTGMTFIEGNTQNTKKSIDTVYVT